MVFIFCLQDGVFIYLCDDGPPTFKEKNVVVGELRQALVSLHY